MSLDNRTAREIADKISWRDPEALISASVVLIFGAGYVAAYMIDVPVSSAQAIGQLQGASITALSSVVAYWLGSSRGSKRNAERADRALDVVQEAHNDQSK